MKESRYARGAGRVALVAMLSALALIGLFAASVLPTGQLGMTAAAGILPALALISGGPAAGLMCYGAAGLLALVLIPDKGAALLFLLFFGLYPLVKHWIERLGRLILEWIVKLLVCNAALLLFWTLLQSLLLGQLPDAFGSLMIFWPAGNLCFVLYDLGLARLLALYYSRVHRAVFRR